MVRTMQAGGRDVEIIGHIAWWNIRGVEVARDIVIEHMADHSIEAEHASEHRWKKTLKTTLKMLRLKLKGYMIEVVKETDDRIIIQFTVKSIKENGESEMPEAELQYTKDTTIVVEKNEDLLNTFRNQVVKGDLELREELVSQYEEEKDKYRSMDVTRIIHSVFDAEADILRLRDSGGTYFIAAGYTDLMNSVSATINAICGVGTFEAIPMLDVEASRSSVRGAAADEMRAIMQDMAEELVAVANGKRKAGKRWFRSRIEDIETMQRRVGIYAPVLEEIKDQIIEEARGLEAEVNRVRNLILGDDDEEKGEAEEGKE